MPEAEVQEVFVEGLSQTGITCGALHRTYICKAEVAINIPNHRGKATGTCKSLLQSNLQSYNKDKTPDVETSNSPACQDC